VSVYANARRTRKHPLVARRIAELQVKLMPGPEDMRAVLAANVSRQQIEDALAVSFAFNTIDRLADAFGFHVPGPDAFKVGAMVLLARGYR